MAVQWRAADGSPRVPRVQGSGPRANKKTAGGVTPAAVGYGRG
ncbi:MAG: hypothetical protein ACK46M_09695 [Planctomyces sp.]